MKKKFPPGISAFSLSELLIAVALTGVVLSLLLPAVQTLRGKAHDSRCMNNLRALGMAGIAHAQERNGLLPDMGLYNSIKVSEAKYSLLPYLGYPVNGNRYEEPTIFTCPLAWKDAPTETPTYRTYAINRYASSSRVNQPEDFNKIKDVVPLRLQNVSGLSKMAFFMDGYHRGGGATATYYIDQNYDRLKPQTTRYLHGNAIHAVFMDGHVEQIKAAYAEAELIGRSQTTHPFWGARK